MFIHVCNKGNRYCSRCTCIYVYSHVYARVKQVTLVRFLLYVYSREFTFLCTCATRETGTVLAVRVFTFLCTCATRETGTVLAVRVTHPLTGPIVGVHAWRLPQRSFSNWDGCGQHRIIPVAPDPSTLECCPGTFFLSSSFSAAFGRAL